MASENESERSTQSVAKNVTDSKTLDSTDSEEEDSVLTNHLHQEVEEEGTVEAKDAYTFGDKEEPRGQRHGRGQGRGSTQRSAVLPQAAVPMGRGQGRGSTQRSAVLPQAAVPMSGIDTAFEAIAEFCPLREAGPQIPEGSSPNELDMFSQFFNDQVIESLVVATNDYAEQKDSKRSAYRRYKLSPLTKEEMWRYLGFFLLLSISSTQIYRQACNPKSSQVSYNRQSIPCTLSHY